MIDVHNHILFGADDGIRTFEEAVQALREFQKNGLEFIVFTPHLGHPGIESNLETIRRNYEALNEECKKMKIACALGSEVYLAPRTQNIIPILDRFVLVESDSVNYPMYLLDKIFELQLNGYDVILAHVERYSWLRQNERVLNKLKDMNVYFQVNVNSLDSKNFFLKNGYVDFIATDYHGDDRERINWDNFRKYRDLVEKGRKILGV
ncbi:CpsB/CapC family capsule biosynthesis tyrosine phosphatase [Pseudothermotoga sp.]